MKFFVSIAVITFISVVVYYLNKKNKRRATVLTALVAVLLLGFLAFVMYRDTTLTDLQCSATHTTATTPPVSLKTAADYFEQGNYDYDIGNCSKAIIDYTGSCNYPKSKLYKCFNEQRRYS